MKVACFPQSSTTNNRSHILERAKGLGDNLIISLHLQYPPICPDFPSSPILLAMQRLPAFPSLLSSLLLLT